MTPQAKTARTKHRAAQARYYRNAKTCPDCGTQIPYPKRRNTYCNQACAARHLKPRKGTGTQHPGCRKCGAPTSTRNHVYNTFCDPCIAAGEHIRRARSSEECKSDKALRSYLLRTRPHRCETCGRKTWQGQPIPLEVDHKDGNGTNNKENNVHLICPNCHAQRPTSKGKNRGKGRKKRREWRRRQKHSLP